MLENVLTVYMLDSR